MSRSSVIRIFIVNIAYALKNLKQGKFMIFFDSILNVLGRINNGDYICKNILKFIICVFVMSGLAACSDDNSNVRVNTSPTTDDVILLTDRANQDSLEAYTLENFKDTFLNDIIQKIEENSATGVIITISNSDSGVAKNVILDTTRDNWKDSTMDIFGLIGGEDGNYELTIVITYFSDNGQTGTETTGRLTIFFDSTAPFISSITPTIDFLPITNKENFSFTITFNENINIDTFTAEDFTITPAGLVSVTGVSFDSGTTVPITATTATVTVTTDIPTIQSGDLTISVGVNYEDEVGNEATEDTQLYEIDVELPTVITVDHTTTETDNEYSIIYTFSEEIEGITASNFEIITGVGMIASDIIHDKDTVTLSVTNADETITIRVRDFVDIDKNIGNETIRTLELGELTIIQSDLTIEDGDIYPSGDNYIFTLRFTADVLAESVSKDDFMITAPGNITILNITPSTGIVKAVTVEFKFTDANNTAKDEITIVKGSIRNDVQTNNNSIVISIDRAPRILSIGGNNKTKFNKSDLEGISNVISYTLNFSEAIDGLDKNDFIITPDSNVSAQTVTPNADLTEATVDFIVVGNTDAAFSIALPNGSYTDQGGNENKETIADLPINITIDTIAPTITGPTDYNVATQSFTLTIDFSEALNLDSTHAVIFESNIELTNASTTDSITIDNNGSEGNGRAEIVLSIDVSKTQATITISGNSYSDTLGNTGENNYTFTIDVESLVSNWFTVGACQNFPFDGGTGSASKPYQISHICQIQNIDDNTVDSLGYTNLLAANYILIADIDASYTRNWNSEQGFNPIGNITNGYTGTFDGEGFTIRNLTIDRSGDNNVALFGSNSGIIKDFTLENIDITGNNFVGGFVGQNDGTIDNGNVSGSVNGAEYVGGLVGLNNGTIENSSSSSSVNGNNYAGGLVGSNYDGTISNSISSGSVNGNSYAGGLVGSNYDGTISNSISSGSVNGNSYVGGLVGSNNSGTILNSSSSGSVDGIDNVGGLVGHHIAGMIDNSSAFGNVSGGSNNVGGFVGLSQVGTILNSTSSGSVSGSNAGGFIGFDLDGIYSGDRYCQQDSSLPAVGNNSNITGITTYDVNCEFIPISTTSELQAINNNLNANYRLVNDIDLSGVDFMPLGNLTNNFDGTFDGNGFTIRNLTIDLPASSNLGLFGVNSGTIHDVTLDNADITGNNFVGGLVGQNIAGSYSGNRYCQHNSEISAVGTNEYIPGITTYEANCEVILISTADGLQAINGNLNENYRLVNDIDLSGVDFMPLGNLANFDGTFDGRGFTIRNLTINSPSVIYVGLFGYNTGTIKDITLDSVDITGNNRVGGLVGYSVGGTILNSSSSGSVSGNNNIGGLIGYSVGGTISSSSFSGNVEGNFYVGGLVGYNLGGTILSSGSSGNIEGNFHVGGLIGSNNFGPINHSRFSGSVSGGFFFGGFVGSNDNGFYVNNIWCNPAGVNDPLQTAGKGGDDDGNVEGIDQYICISTADELQDINDNLSEGYMLINDIDLSGVSFTPIGDYDNTFDGTFDGGGFTISNFTINSLSSSYVGLFGYNEGTIRGVILENATITVGNFNIGGLVGYNEGTIENSISSGSVRGNFSVGGLVGFNNGIIDNSSSSASIKGVVLSAGGLVGNNNGTINMSSSSGNVNGNLNTGGFVGNNGGTISNSSSFGSISGILDAGGFVGYNEGTIENSNSSAGSVLSNGNTGGFVGMNDSDSTYINDEWCVIGGSSLEDSGDDGDIDEIDFLGACE